MSGPFCPDDWHGTTEADLQQMSWGEDYFYWSDVVSSVSRITDAANMAASRVEDRARALAKADGLVFHTLPIPEQVKYLDMAEASPC